MTDADKLKAAQAYVDAYRNWHIGGDYSKASMLRFRATKAVLLAAFPEVLATIDTRAEVGEEQALDSIALGEGWCDHTWIAVKYRGVVTGELCTKCHASQDSPEKTRESPS